ncbi:hypothetical protein FGO68_gene11512 [Halteria grandinella]|uniref:GPI ethanolamine phosphate transferase 3 n=1 Tax=Halteria grandinella TaxID=5974 RepID=A0A8J8P2L9_HALGN|nr:hypothetical protein FGO68_gene11512 [Halteria grandinella]
MPTEQLERQWQFKWMTFKDRPQFRFALSLLILFLVAENYFSKSIFLSKRIIKQKSESFSHEYYQNSTVPPKKLIMLMVDALREDFVEMDDLLVPNQRIFHKDSFYTHRRLQLFNNLLREQPHNTILIPMLVQMPTVTMIRIQGTMTGALNSYIEIKDNFQSKLIEEDSILYQLNNRGYPRKYPTSDQSEGGEYIVFAGDFIWEDQFGPYFNRSYFHSSFNVRDLDSHDLKTTYDLMNIMNDKNFTLLLGHIIGVDHGGHSGGANNLQIERKLYEAEQLIQNIINLMDNDTVLMVYGDHGMGNGGHHGGSTLLELSSAFFAYTKGGFPVKTASQEVKEHFDSLQASFKQLDIPSIATAILDLPIPFSNVGTLNPYLYTSLNINQLHQRMIKQVEQVALYVKVYCAESKDYWCSEKIIEMDESMEAFKSKYDDFQSDTERAEQIAKMHTYLNGEYQTFAEQWIYFSPAKMSFSIAIIVILLLEVVLNLLNEETTQIYSFKLLMLRGALFIPIIATQNSYNYFTLTSTTVYLITSLYIIYQAQKLKLFGQFVGKFKAMLIQTSLTIPTLITVFGIIIQSYSCYEDYMTQEFDTACEAIMVAIFISLWIVQQRSVRYSFTFVLSFSQIVICLKLAYFFDQDFSLNFKLKEPFKGWKETLQSTQMASKLSAFSIMFVS